MNIVLIRACEWEGLYVDGGLVCEDHSVDAEVIIEQVGGKVQWLTDAQDKALCAGGNLPPKLEDVSNLGAAR